MPVGTPRNLNSFASYIQIAVLSTHEDRRHPGDNTRSSILLRIPSCLKIMALPNKLAYIYWYFRLYLYEVLVFGAYGTKKLISDRA